MNIFIIHSSAQIEQFKKLKGRLAVHGHQVFEPEDLPRAEAYDLRIEEAITKTDLVVFLISRQAIADQAYPLTELKHTERRWPDPTGHVIGVFADDTPNKDVPPYLQSASILRPRGNLEAEVVSEIAKLQRGFFGNVLVQSWRLVVDRAGSVALLLGVVLLSHMFTPTTLRGQLWVKGSGSEMRYNSKAEFKTLGFSVQPKSPKSSVSLVLDLFDRDSCIFCLNDPDDLVGRFQFTVDQTQTGRSRQIQSTDPHQNATMSVTVLPR